MCCKYFPSRVSSCHVGARSVPVASVHIGSVHNRSCTYWACPLLAHRCGTVRPISWRSVNLDFCPLQLPLHPMGLTSLSRRTHGVKVQGSGDDGSKACGSTVSIQIPWTVSTPDRLFGSHYVAWHMSLFHWILSQIEASLHLPCTSSINITLFLSHFSSFCWKHTVRAHPSSLSETTQFSCCIRHQHPPFNHSLTW